MRYSLGQFVAAACGGFACVVLLGAAPARADPITYFVAIPLVSLIPSNVASQIVGTITTDGSTGPLLVSDITSWNLAITVGNFSGSVVSGTSFVTDVPVQPCCVSSHAPISATATSLFFDFSQSGSSGSPNGVSFLNFENNDHSSDVLFIASGLIQGYLANSSSIYAYGQLFPLGGVQVIGSTTFPPPPLTTVPGPIAGAGLPALLAFVSLLLGRWRRRSTAAPLSRDDVDHLPVSIALMDAAENGTPRSLRCPEPQARLQSPAETSDLPWAAYGATGGPGPDFWP